MRDYLSINLLFSCTNAPPSFLPFPLGVRTEEKIGSHDAPSSSGLAKEGVLLLSPGKREELKQSEKLIPNEHDEKCVSEAEKRNRTSIL